MAYEEMADEADAEEAEAKPAKGVAALVGYAGMDNIALALDSDQLAKIGQQVIDEYETDLASMDEWLNGHNKGLELAKLVTTEKTFPWPGAANIKFPLIANAAMKFGARAYPEIIRNSEVVSCRTIGLDPNDAKHARGKRVAGFMNWQLLVQSEDWDSDMDKLLSMLPAVGQLFKKTYFHPVLGRNVSELVMGDKLIVNQQAQSWEKARRRTHVYELYHNEVVEQQRMELFVECDLRSDDNEDAPDDEIHELLEQHRFLDLDDDGYEEPYIVTVDKASAKVLRIRARFDAKGIKKTKKGNKIASIKADEYFTPYGFFPAFDGSLHHIGFGHLLFPLNEAANTLINQLLDAGTLANTQAGFIGNGLKIRGGNMRFSAGEWKRVDASGGKIAENVFPLPTKEASPTLFNLLGMIIESANEIGMVSDILNGDVPSANVPATTVLALIEQGQKAFNAVYKRIWRSLSAELRKLNRLNSVYADPQEYISVIDDPEATLADFAQSDNDIMPVADPAISSQAQRMAQAQAAMTISGRPGVDEALLTSEYLKAIGHPKADMLAPTNPNGMQNGMMEQAQQQAYMKGGQDALSNADLVFKDRELQLKEREVAIKERESGAKQDQIEAVIQKTIAETIEKLIKIPPAVAIAAAQAASVIQEQAGIDNETYAGAIPGMAGAPGDGAYFPDAGGLEGGEGAFPEGMVPVEYPEPEPFPIGDAGEQQPAIGSFGGSDDPAGPGV